MQGSGFRVQGSGFCWVQGSGFRVLLGSGLRNLLGSGFRVQGSAGAAAVASADVWVQGCFTFQSLVVVSGFSL